MPDSTQFKIKTYACSSVVPQPNGTGSTREAHFSWDISPTVTHGSRPIFVAFFRSSRVPHVLIPAARSAAS
ncbi:hypothetical protein C8R43DRAFT_1137198 [Mycena crocata]|nr:hypothetical protein C8R43DRAFT_1137198 [Mycena crocata]